MRRLCVICLLLLLAGCGKKGALIPPEALVPAPVDDLQLVQRGETFRISWRGPGREESGRPLRGGVRFRLQRREVRPPGQDCAVCPDVWKLLADIDPAVLSGVERSDGRYTYTDRDALPDVTYQYRVQAVDASGGLSRISQLPARQRLAPPLPPVLQAKAGDSGVLLEFVAPTSASRETNVGYLLFRQEEGRPPRQLTAAPVTAVTFVDHEVRLGATYRYSARTVAVIGGQTVESADSNEAVVTVTLPE